MQIPFKGSLLTPNFLLVMTFFFSLLSALIPQKSSQFFWKIKMVRVRKRGQKAQKGSWREFHCSEGQVHAKMYDVQNQLMEIPLCKDSLVFYIKSLGT